MSSWCDWSIFCRPEKLTFHDVSKIKKKWHHHSVLLVIKIHWWSFQLHTTPATEAYLVFCQTSMIKKCYQKLSVKRQKDESQIGGNKKARQIYRKTNISYPLICTRMSFYLITDEIVKDFQLRTIFIKTFHHLYNFWNREMVSRKVFGQ